MPILVLYSLELSWICRSFDVSGPGGSGLGNVVSADVPPESLCMLALSRFFCSVIHDGRVEAYYLGFDLLTKINPKDLSPCRLGEVNP